MTTIKDIARIAGVSITTVSRALNDYSDVSENTRQRIKAIAKDLNYSPNAHARSLVTNKSKTIGLLVSDINKGMVKDNFLVEILSGIDHFVAQTDYDLVLFSTNSTKQREKTYSQLCRERRVDGVILQGIKTEDPYLREVIESDIPCVLIDIPIESSTVGYVTTDNVMGSKKAVEYLIQLGHEKIAMMNGHNFAFVSQSRLKGYFEALKEAHLSVNWDWIVNGAFDEGIAENVATNLLTKHPEITAIYCASDLMALGTMKAAKKLGINIPEELSIIGFDDILLASYVSPPLTTVAQNKSEMGYQAAKLLVEMLEDKDVSHAISLDTKLIVRESSGVTQQKIN
ncbi:LacI family DNA-binding transcriptional regulator [Lederbergia citrea]|uniref:LacI family DNA-binding transcriptional regulator n=1 Tax=Lederbergia citrea TaxID=2833581 RepID=A0A942Z450_9BACI|nr:LacI family DNA-binding transcriptional regulator [Lederbergia citrea]MBS4204014.1 LacI family DNA-binding transcriptional regulator [Lederbergia citrea]MBS4221401.1 LacI family DNA-binding transcriptional regulator [Lederbergia citrea]